MQIESILIFIVFVVISTFASKRKTAQQRQQQQQQTQKTTTAVSPKPMPQKSSKRTLQDLFREMQQELETEYREVQETASNSKKTVMAPTTAPETRHPFTYERTRPDIKGPTATTAKEKKLMKANATRMKSPVYEDEIKDTPSDTIIDLSQDSVLKGIIFSEILGKPKALK